MGNETSDSSSSSMDNDSDSDVQNAINPSAVMSNEYRPSLSNGIYGIYSLQLDKIMMHHMHSDKNMFESFIPFNHWKIKLCLQYFERMYSMEIVKSVIFNLCCLYFDDNDIGDCFDENNKGMYCKLSDQNRKCLRIQSKTGSNTVYGKMLIAKHPIISAYKWKFKILSKKLKIYIGIDSNPSFARSDFSNYFRNFKTLHDDIFCSYGSDGNVFHFMSRDANSYGIEWKMNDEIEMMLCVKSETLSYCVNGKYQGIAMNNLKINKGGKTFKMAVTLFFEDDAIELIDFSVREKE